MICVVVVLVCGVDVARRVVFAVVGFVVVDVVVGVVVCVFGVCCCRCCVVLRLL